jgi:hypothetical protein
MNRPTVGSSVWRTLTLRYAARQLELLREDLQMFLRLM